MDPKQSKLTPNDQRVGGVPARFHVRYGSWVGRPRRSKGRCGADLGIDGLPIDRDAEVELHPRLQRVMRVALSNTPGLLLVIRSLVAAAVPRMWPLQIPRGEILLEVPWGPPLLPWGPPSAPQGPPGAHLCAHHLQPHLRFEGSPLTPAGVRD